MKNDATFVRMRNGDHLGDGKNVEKEHPAPSNLTLLRIAIDENGFRRSNESRRADLPKVASKFLIFAWGISYDLSKLCDDFTPFFRL